MSNGGPYNLKYLISAALLDDQVEPDQLQPQRIQSPDAQAMVARIEVRSDSQLTARFSPRACGPRDDSHEGWANIRKGATGLRGGIDQPMSWSRVVDKFHWLSERFADEALRNRIVQTVQEIDARPISDVMNLLAQVQPTEVFPKTRRGI